MDDRKKLQEIANQLLDLGKRNNLINYRDTKTGTAEVLLLNSDTFFGKSGATARFEVFDPKIVSDEDILYGYEKPKSSEPIPDRETYIRTYAPKLKKASQLLLYNRESDPVTVVRSIAKKAKTAMEETGVNVAYMACGFVHWKEQDHSEMVYRAPLLLVPVTITCESMITPVQIHTSGDELVVNPTFAYKLKQEYGIELPEYTDQELDVYCDAVEVLVRKLGWLVTHDFRIGIFSFLKINMYQDLNENAAAVLSNGIVRALMDAEGDSDPSLTPLTERMENPLVEMHNVVDADSSQLEAIEMAKAGKSFVLQGPPGTGKSQTITNIIAECLSDGRKVLFVSEKLAALNVVYDKLKKAGLEEFCLELHSYKANKKAVIDELCRTLRAERRKVSGRAEEEILRKKRSQKQLDAYAEELHREQEGIHKSFYQLENACSSLRFAPDSGYRFLSLAEKGASYDVEAEELLGQYKEYAALLGEDYRNNCWYGYRDTAGTEDALRKDLKIVATVCEELLPYAEVLQKEYGLSCRSLHGLRAVKELLERFGSSTLLTPEILHPETVQSVKEKAEKLEGIAALIKEKKAKIDADYEKAVYTLNGGEMKRKLERQFDGLFSRLFSGEYKSLVQKLRNAGKRADKVSYEEAVRIASLLADYEYQRNCFLVEEGNLPDVLGSGYAKENTDWETLKKDCAVMEEVLRYEDCTMLASMPKDLPASVRAAMVQQARGLQEILAVSEEAEEMLCASFDPMVYDLAYRPLHEVMEKLDACAQNMRLLDSWKRLIKLLDRMEESDVSGYLHAALDRGVGAENLLLSFRKAFYEQWMERVRGGSEVLSSFNRVSQDQAVKSFADSDETQFRISRAQIRSELSAKKPAMDFMAPGSAVAKLLREGEKKRRQKSIRVLLEETGELVQVLKPCFLMSPLSVSTYLSSDAIHFDTVIFDEASQIFPQDAIGAIYRGSQLIVVGDSKQMPPSNFFNVSLENEEEEESGDVKDFESILDMCATRLPQIRLKWHYRSRYEELIAFSNRNFYDNDLVTFPSSGVDRPGAGVDFCFTEGTYDHKSRSNRKEAEAVVERIYRHFREYPERSLGVVAFSISQQNLIERLLSMKRREDPSLETFFSSSVPEPFFVKNLETVQGDERDTILFSVGYAKDERGILMHNFGPLNRAGGERRLNVAITRAKMNVQLVASIHTEDIDLSRTSALGAKLLRDYLDYAEHGTQALQRALTVQEDDVFDSSFEQEVCDFLREHGYTVDTQVGCSGFKIDLGLRREDSSDYVLAIECDGATYHSSRNARDRDRLRQQVLERMGWKFHRVWSTDWFHNRASEQHSLLEACHRALYPEEVEAKVVERSAGAEEDFEEEAFVPHRRFAYYETVNVEEILQHSVCYADAVKTVLMKEAPLSEEWLLKRTCSYFNREKVTEAVRQAYEKEMRQASRYGIVRKNGFLYLQEMHSYRLRVPMGETKRELKYISPQELAAGIHTVVKQSVSADANSVYRYLVNRLGYTRVTDAVQEQMEEALQLLKGRVERDGDKLIFNSNLQ